jgi:hypothetical protein
MAAFKCMPLHNLPNSLDRLMQIWLQKAVFDTTVTLRTTEPKRLFDSTARFL